MTDPHAECACGNRLYPPAAQCDECIAAHATAARQGQIDPALTLMEEYATHIQKSVPADIDPPRLSHAVEALDLIGQIRAQTHPPRELAERLKQSARRHRRTGSPYLSTSMEMLADQLSPLT